MNGNSSEEPQSFEKAARNNEEKNDESNKIRISERRTLREWFDLEGNQESRAMAINSVAQGYFIIGGVYLSTAILRLSYTVGECKSLPPTECTVLGLKPSSLLSTMTSISAFTSSVLMPIIGAIVDHTDYRRMIALISGVLMVIINFFSIFIGENTWWFIVFLNIIQPIVFTLHQLTIFAYLNEITEDESNLTRLLSVYQGIRQTAMLSNLLIVLLASSLWPNVVSGTLEYDVMSARIAQVLITSVTFVSIFFTFFRGVKPRKALSAVPERSTVLTAGFKKLINTFISISSTLPAVKWFLVSAALFGAILGATISVAITYLIFFLNYGSFMIGIATIVYLGASIFGAMIVPMLANAVGLKRCLEIVLFCLMIIWGAVGLLKGPEHANYFLIFSTFWGFLAGMIIPNSRALYLRIIPKGQDAEFIGIYLFCTNGFVWLPPLIMTLINEAGLSFRYILPILGFFVLFALIALMLIGDFDKAKEVAEALGNSVRNDANMDGLEEETGSSDIILQDIISDTANN